MKKCILILMTLLIVGCVAVGLVNGKMWGATEPPIVNGETVPVVESFADYETGPTMATSYGDENSGDTPITQEDGNISATQQNGQYPEHGEVDSPQEEKPDYVGKFIMTAETAELIGHRNDRTYFLNINSDGTFVVRADYQLDGEYEYELHSGEYKVVSENELEMKLTTFETSVGNEEDKNKYKDAKAVKVTLKDDVLTCKQGRKKYSFEKLA